MSVALTCLLSMVLPLASVEAVRTGFFKGVGKCFSLETTRRLSLYGHSIARAAFGDATFASHFTRTSSPTCLSLSAPTLVSPSVLVAGVGGQNTNSCWLKHGRPGCGRTKTSSTSTLDKVGRPQRIGPPGGGSILRGWSQRKCMSGCGTGGHKAFSLVLSGSCV